MRLHQLLKAKIHHARVTYANPEYVGSIEIDGDILKRVGILDGEMVQVWAVDRAARIATYAFSGQKGVVGLNGGAAHFFSAGDRIIVSAFTWTDERVAPKIVLLNEKNEIVRDITPYSVAG